MKVGSKTAKPKKSLKKVSSHSGSDQVAEFMLSLGHPLKKIVETVRSVILSSDKDLTEHIKWNAPSFCIDGDDRITFNLSKKDCVLLIFHRGAKVKDTKGKEPLFTDATGLLEWLSPDRAVIKFTHEAETASKKAALKKVVQQWIAQTRKD